MCMCDDSCALQAQCSPHLHLQQESLPFSNHIKCTFSSNCCISEGRLSNTSLTHTVQWQQPRGDRTGHAADKALSMLLCSGRGLLCSDVVSCSTCDTHWVPVLKFVKSGAHVQEWQGDEWHRNTHTHTTLCFYMSPDRLAWGHQCGSEK